ncbi:MAG: MarR family winged helix-turn-helix transcriptional regulator [Anaerolineae bacterium]
MPPTGKRFDDPVHREKWLALIQSLNPGIDPQAIRLMDEMRMVARALYHVGESSLTDSGLSYAQYGVLMRLFFNEQMGEGGELNPSEISDRLGTSRNTVSGLIRGLEQQELVERRLDEHDRRKFNIRLTEDGRARVRDHVRQHFNAIGRCFSVLTPEEIKTMSRLLAKLRATAFDLKRNE